MNIQVKFGFGSIIPIYNNKNKTRVFIIQSLYCLHSAQRSSHIWKWFELLLTEINSNKKLIPRKCVLSEDCQPSLSSHVCLFSKIPGYIGFKAIFFHILISSTWQVSQDQFINISRTGSINLVLCIRFAFSWFIQKTFFFCFNLPSENKWDLPRNYGCLQCRHFPLW